MKQDSIAKKVLLEELYEQGHPEPVENVIFWALEHYAKSQPAGTWGRIISYSIKERILEEEAKAQLRADEMKRLEDNQQKLDL